MCKLTVKINYFVHLKHNYFIILNTYYYNREETVGTYMFKLLAIVIDSITLFLDTAGTPCDRVLRHLQFQ